MLTGYLNMDSAEVGPVKAMRYHWLCDMNWVLLLMIYYYTYDWLDVDGHNIVFTFLY